MKQDLAFVSSMACRNRGSLTGTLPTVQPIMQEAETDIFQGSRCRERISRSKRRYAHRLWSHQIFHGCLCVGTLAPRLSGQLENMVLLVFRKLQSPFTRLLWQRMAL